MTTSIQKQLRTAWVRAMGRIANLVQTMEGELEKMRAKNVSKEFIAEKSSRIDCMIDVVNLADEIITAQRNEIIALRIENTLLINQMSDAQTLEFLTKPNSTLIRSLHEAQKKPASH